MVVISEVDEALAQLEELEKQEYDHLEPSTEDEEDDEDDLTEDDDDGDKNLAKGRGEGRPLLSRHEKKVRKAMLKLKMKLVPGVNRVTLKKTKDVMYCISNPDVFKSASCDTYVIIGEAKIEEPITPFRNPAAEQFFLGLGLNNVASNPGQSSLIEDVEEEKEEGDIDDMGFDAGDIDLVIMQTDVSRQKAVRALQVCNGDIVSAIMSLT